MPDRANHLARTLISRLSNLRTRFAEEGLREPDRRQRIDEIEKVLVVELGTVDPATLASIEAAEPNPLPGQAAGEREVAAFAAFLRRQLAALL